MKKRLKISTLIFGIIVAVLALSSSSSYAEKSERSEVVQFQLSESEIQNVIEQVLDDSEITTQCDECLKIYNQDNQLVYESRDKDDERIKILLRRSDLILRTDSSSYYLLSN